MAVSAAIYGLSGPSVSAAERGFFRDAAPWGFILFQRNCETPEQVRGLVDELRAIAGWHAPVLIDQEGGRVQRLKPPHWPARPAARLYGQLALGDGETAREAVYLHARLLAADLMALGIDVDCWPLLDLPVAGAHDVIGDRAFSQDAAATIDLARAACEGLRDGGVLPVIKHIPGHGRAGVDSHLSLPVVDTDLDTLRHSDFVPFRALADQPLAMTAHVVFTALDAGRPVTTSSRAIHTAIRGDIGFDGLLMSDDVSMRALSGTLGERTRAALGAGCDVVLHCNGQLPEMEAVAAETKPLSGKALARAEAALALRRAPAEGDIAALAARHSELTAAA